MKPLSSELKLLLAALLSVGAAGTGYSFSEYQHGYLQPQDTAQDAAYGKLQNVVSLTVPTLPTQSSAAQATRNAAVDAAKKANPKIAAAAGAMDATQAALDGDKGTVPDPANPTAAPVAPTATTTPQGINPAAPLAPVPARNPFRPYAATSDTASTSDGGSTSDTPALPTPTPSTAPGSGAGTRTAGVLPPPAVTITPGITPPGSTNTPNRNGVLPPVSISTGAAQQDVARQQARAAAAQQAAQKAAQQKAAAQAEEARRKAEQAARLAAQKAAAQKAAQEAAAREEAKRKAEQAAALRAAQAQARQQARPAEPSLGSAVHPQGAGLPGGAVGTAGALPGAGTVGVTGISPDVQAQGSAQPGVITQVQTPGVGAGTPLENYENQHSLQFTAVVLGPIDTAVFKIDGNFVVVSSGQKIPDTDIVVSDISTTKVKLTLKNDTQTLVLDNQVNK